MAMVVETEFCECLGIRCVISTQEQRDLIRGIEFTSEPTCQVYRAHVTNMSTLHDRCELVMNSLNGICSRSMFPIGIHYVRKIFDYLDNVSFLCPDTTGIP